MKASSSCLPVYLDQNVLSHLRMGQAARQGLLDLFRRLEENGAVFAYSMVHVEECRNSAQPEAFVEVMEELPIYFMEFQEASDQKMTLVPGRARELVLSSDNVIHELINPIYDVLRLPHFASGWLDDYDLHELVADMKIGAEGFCENLLQGHDFSAVDMEVTDQFHKLVASMRDELFENIENMPFVQARQETKDFLTVLNSRLPANYAQLDAIPDEQVVSFIFSRLDEKEKEALEIFFPQGSWRRLGMRRSGALAGLAFALFLYGLVRDRRVKTRSIERREQHFLGQFRDCVHIENAARCALFVTCDAGAARLARSLYAYAGVETRVVELEFMSANTEGA